MDKTQKITAENMPQKGKMRKIQPADDCGKDAAGREKCEKYDQRMTAANMPQKGEMKKLRQIADCGILPQSGKMRDKRKRAHGNRPHRTLRLQLRWGMPVPRIV